MSKKSFLTLKVLKILKASINKDPLNTGSPHSNIKLNYFGWKLKLKIAFIKVTPLNKIYVETVLGTFSRFQKKKMIPYTVQIMRANGCKAFFQEKRGFLLLPNGVNLHSCMISNHAYPTE